jgi:hypothetical protein
MSGRRYTLQTSVSGFSAYFETSASTRELLEAMDYRYDQGRPELPHYAGELSFVGDLAGRIERVIPRVTMTSEAARREFLIAPLLTELALGFGVQISVEYVLEVSQTLRGSLDYLLENQGRDVVVVEAKLGDLYRGFRQLAAELVAVDQWTDSTATHLYGAVTVGDVWRFGVLDRSAKTLTEDIGEFAVPRDLEDLARVLLGALVPDGASAAPA